MENKNLLSFVKETDLVKFCQEIVRIKSVNPPGDELQAAEYVASAFKKIGLEVELIKHSPTRASVLARLKSSRKKPALLFNGHLDTVPVGAEKWIHEPFEGVLSEGKIWGRGSADMKGGLAVLMGAATALLDARGPLQGALILTAT